MLFRSEKLMSKRATIVLVIVLLLTLFATSAGAHSDPDLDSNVLHGIQHLVMWQDYLFVILGAGLVVAVSVGRAILRKISR